MPVYQYRCSDCEHDFEIRHSMNFSDQLCLKCNSKNIFKVPSLMNHRVLKNETEPGKIVDNYIKETKKEINKEKKALKSRKL